MTLQFDISVLASTVGEGGTYSFTLTPKEELLAAMEIRWVIVPKGKVPITKNDFSALEGTVNFVSGTAAAKTIDITPTDDSVAEVSGEFEIQIYQVVSDGNDILIDSQDVVLTDDDDFSSVPASSLLGDGNANNFFFGSSNPLSAEGVDGDDVYVISRYQTGNVILRDGFDTNTIKLDYGVQIISATKTGRGTGGGELLLGTDSANPTATVTWLKPASWKYQIGDGDVLSWADFLAALGPTTGTALTNVYTVDSLAGDSVAEGNESASALLGSSADEVFSFGGDGALTAEGVDGDDVYVISRYQTGNVTLKDGFDTNIIKLDYGVQIISATKTGRGTGGGELLLGTDAANPTATVTWLKPASWQYQIGDGAVLSWADFLAALGPTTGTALTNTYTVDAAPIGSVTLSFTDVNDDKAATVGETLTATPSFTDINDSVLTYTYVWTQDGVAISGATSATYTPTVAGDYTVVVTVIDSVTGVETEFTADAVAVVAAVATPSEPTNVAPTLAASSTSVNVDENADGAAVASLTITDTDGKDGNNAVYSASDFSISGTGNEKFEIVASNGGFLLQLKATESLDFEATPNSYSLTITLDDGDASTTDPTVTIAVNASDTNDAPMFADASDADLGGTLAVSIAENTTAVTTLKVLDADASSSTTYTLSGDDADLFSISPTGALAFKVAPNFEDPTDKNTDNDYAVTVTVSDGTATDTIDVTVSVDDASDPSSLMFGTNRFEVVKGTTYTLKASDIIHTDADAADSDFYYLASSFTITSLPSAANVSLVFDGAAVTVGQVIPLADIAKLQIVVGAGASGLSTFGYTVQVEADTLISGVSLPGATASATVNIVATSGLSRVTSMEVDATSADATTPIAITLNIAIQPETGNRFGNTDFKITGTESDKFHIVELSLGNYRLERLRTEVLTAETTLTITFTDPLTEQTLSQTVTITPVAPSFVETDDSDNLVALTDGSDATINQTVFAFINKTAGHTFVSYTLATDLDNTDGLFAIRTATLGDAGLPGGEIYLTKALPSVDYETKSSYRVTLTAKFKDSDDNDYTISKVIEIGVDNVNDSPPIITSDIVGAVEAVATSTTDVVYDGEGIGDVNAIEWSLKGDDASLFNINTASGEVTFKDPTTPVVGTDYSFTIVATSGNFASEQEVDIKVNPTGAPTITSKGLSDVVLTENEAVAITDVVYTATSSTTGVSWSLKSGVGDVALFAIDSTGKVTFLAARTPDYETQSSYSFTIIATAGGVAAEQNVRIDVGNVDDAAPVQGDGAVGVTFPGVITLSENNFKVTDVDTPDDQLIYTPVGLGMLGGVQVGGQTSTSFTQADLKAGTVTLFVFSTPPSIDFTVTDGGGNSITVTLQSAVSASSGDTPPALIDSSLYALATGTANNDRLVKALSTGGPFLLQGGDGDDVLRSKGDSDILIGGDGDDTIDTLNGRDTIVYSYYSAETGSVASDGGDTVTDFTVGMDKFIFVDLGGVGNTLSGIVKAFLSNDINLVRVGAEVTLTIEFDVAVGGAGKTLTIQIANDAVLTNQWGAIYEAGSDSSGSASDSLTIDTVAQLALIFGYGGVIFSDGSNLGVDILDENNVAPIITSDAAVTIDDGTVFSSTTPIYTATVAPDVAGATVVWTIREDGDPKLFSINSEGEVTFNRDTTIDYETGRKSYAFAITARVGSLSVEQVVQVTVADVAEAPVIDEGDSTDDGARAVSVVEGSTTIATFAASDGDGDTLTYSVSDTTNFEISSSGALTFKTAPDFDEATAANNTKTVTVTVTDSSTGALTDTVDVTVTIVEGLIDSSLYNLITGTAGNDGKLSAPRDGNAHLLQGGDGDDIIRSKNQGDVLIGGAGDDTIYTQTGNDTVVYRYQSASTGTLATDGGDTVTDFTVGTDSFIFVDLGGVGDNQTELVTEFLSNDIDLVRSGAEVTLTIEFDVAVGSAGKTLTVGFKNDGALTTQWAAIYAAGSASSGSASDSLTIDTAAQLDLIFGDEGIIFSDGSNLGVEVL